jgi:hypothetical protein
VSIPPQWGNLPNFAWPGRERGRRGVRGDVARIRQTAESGGECRAQERTGGGSGRRVSWAGPALGAGREQLGGQADGGGDAAGGGAAEPDPEAVAGGQVVRRSRLPRWSTPSRRRRWGSGPWRTSSSSSWSCRSSSSPRRVNPPTAAAAFPGPAARGARPLSSRRPRPGRPGRPERPGPAGAAGRRPAVAGAAARPGRLLQVGRQLPLQLPQGRRPAASPAGQAARSPTAGRSWAGRSRASSRRRTWRAPGAARARSTRPSRSPATPGPRPAHAGPPPRRLQAAQPAPGSAPPGPVLPGSCQQAALVAGRLLGVGHGQEQAGRPGGTGASRRWVSSRVSPSSTVPATGTASSATFLGWIDRFPNRCGMLRRKRISSKFREVRADRALPGQAGWAPAVSRRRSGFLALTLVLVLPAGRGRGSSGSKPRSRIPRSISLMAVSTTLTLA